MLASLIVGSGELIATTVGAEAGFALLWLIVIGCAIKVAAQVEIGRNTVTRGRVVRVGYEVSSGLTSATKIEENLPVAGPW